jgi:preprotein translocase subunit YajC
MSLSLISSAMAAAPTHAAPSGQGFQFILFLVIFILFFYLILWRPQSKRAKEQKKLLSNLAKGDEIYSTGGILGVIEKVTDDFVVVAISEGVEIVLQKASVAGTLPKGTIKSV